MSEPSTEPADGDRTRPNRRQFLGSTGLAVAAALPGLAGCLERREPSDPEAVEAVEATTDGDRVTASIDGEQRVDETSRRAHVRVEADDDREEVYVDDDTVYQRCDFSNYVNVEDAWYPAETGVNWEDATLLGGQSALLEISEVYDRGTEALDGREARVIEFAPDPDEFDRYQRRTSVNDEDLATPDSVAVTQWLVDDLPTRIRSAVERSSSGTTIEEDVTYDVTYGPVSIELPPIVDERDACPEP